MGIKIVSISRPYYSKSRIYRGLQNRAQGTNSPSPHGFYFSVQYKWRSRGLKRTKIRDIDSIYFEDPYSPLAGEHLRLILMASEGDLHAQDVLHRRIKGELTRHADFDPRQVDLGEFSDYSVPSTSTESYSPEEMGNEGYDLLKLIRLGYPVPAFCLIDAKVKGGGENGSFKQSKLMYDD